MIDCPLIEETLEEFIPEKTTNEYINKITNRIYLGQIEGATEYEYFKTEGITHSLSVVGPAGEEEKDKIYNITRKELYIHDTETENILRYFKECIEFIDNSPIVYVHCAAGVSRSATIVIAYIMWKTHRGYEEVFQYVEHKRDVGPNSGFKLQLRKFHKLLRESYYDLNKINFNSIDIENLDL